MAHFNQLTPAEAERLALLLEELGEAQQAIGKILRHGYESRNPEISPTPSNREALETEIGDVLCAVDLLAEAGDLRRGRLGAAQESKHNRIGRWLHHAKAEASR